MMTVQDIITDLQLAELSELNIGESANTNANLTKYLMYISAGLTELYTRFPLNQRQLAIQPIEGLTDYLLTPEHAYSNDTDAIKYILDSVYDVFDWDILQILGAYDENGQELPLNNNNHIYGVFSNSPNAIIIPATITARQVILVCQANHPKVTGLDSAIKIPFGLRNALVWLIASRIWSTRKDDGATQKAVQYAQQYNEACLAASYQGTANTLDSVEFNIHQLGWR